MSETIPKKSPFKGGEKAQAASTTVGRDANENKSRTAKSPMKPTDSSPHRGNSTEKEKPHAQEAVAPVADVLLSDVVSSMNSGVRSALENLADGDPDLLSFATKLSTDLFESMIGNTALLRYANLHLLLSMDETEVRAIIDEKNDHGFWELRESTFG